MKPRFSLDFIRKKILLLNARFGVTVNLTTSLSYRIIKTSALFWRILTWSLKRCRIILVIRSIFFGFLLLILLVYEADNALYKDQISLFDNWILYSYLASNRRNNFESHYLCIAICWYHISRTHRNECETSIA
jgi:hypothetical protein